MESVQVGTPSSLLLWSSPLVGATQSRALGIGNRELTYCDDFGLFNPEMFPWIEKVLKSRTLLLPKKTSTHCFCISLFLKFCSTDIEHSIYISLTLLKDNRNRFPWMVPYILHLRVRWSWIISLFLEESWRGITENKFYKNETIQEIIFDWKKAAACISLGSACSLSRQWSLSLSS